MQRMIMILQVNPRLSPEGLKIVKILFCVVLLVGVVSLVLAILGAAGLL